MPLPPPDKLFDSMDRIQEVKASLRFKDNDNGTICVLRDSKYQDLYNFVLYSIADNVKQGPFTATSGQVLPFYLNASTNFLDKRIAPKIVKLLAKFMAAWLPKLSGDANYIVRGMEMAGVLAGQLASANDEDLKQLGDFVYIRKEQKTSGTQQQLVRKTKLHN